MANLTALSTKRKAEEGVEIELHLHNYPGEYTGLFVTIPGPGSAVAKRVGKAMADLEQQAERQRRQVKVDDAKYIEIMSDLILDWREFEETNDKGELVEIPFTKPNVLRVLTENDWIIEQVLSAMKDTKLFISA
ncbi:hypothetical protein JL100_017980 [Skermanella mucosa]|uniref:hypothetical protein n=1 Tax=Skermanella mucosa TaxID=1789672 RepID=UPI00192C035A|nr:hypothetical protein [Skermanella mucosa]UEM18975.1 hypothetical protein JL100_017980 [Skermanella mucosa]